MPPRRAAKEHKGGDRLLSRPLPARAEFRSLTDAEFDRLERLGGIKLSEWMRKWTSARITLHCIDPPKFTFLSTSKADRQRALKKRAQIVKAVTTVRRNIAGSGIFEPHNYLTDPAAEALQRNCELLLADIERRAKRPMCSFNRRGRRTEAFVDGFFGICVDVYQKAGGTVTTGWKKDTRERNSPFQRFLGALYERLPKQQQSLTRKQLGERFHKSYQPKSQKWSHI